MNNEKKRRATRLDDEPSVQDLRSIAQSALKHLRQKSVLEGVYEYVDLMTEGLRKWSLEENRPYATTSDFERKYTGGIRTQLLHISTTKRKTIDDYITNKALSAFAENHAPGQADIARTEAMHYLAALFELVGHTEGRLYCERQKKLLDSLQTDYGVICLADIRWCEKKPSTSKKSNNTKTAS